MMSFETQRCHVSRDPISEAVTTAVSEQLAVDGFIFESMLIGSVTMAES